MALTAKKVYAILKRQISDMEVKLNSPVRYRGTVATADLLPLNPDIGDMYNIESKSIYGEAGMNVAWNGVVWDTMGAPIDMSLYLTKEEAEAVIQRLVTEYFEKNPVKPGATTEQAQQIEQNKTDIASLKEDLVEGDDNYNAYLEIIEKIQTDNPLCMIFILEALNTNAKATLKKISASKNLPFLEIFTNEFYYLSGINGQAVSATHDMKGDPTHLSPVGYLLLARNVVTEMTKDMVINPQRYNQRFSVS